MEELKLTPEQLKELMEDGEMIGQGFFGTTFRYKDSLIKLDNSLYSLLNGNKKKFSDEMFDYRYRWGKENFAKEEQIAFLANKQKDITLTKLPQGIVRVKDVIPGIIIPYHKNHDSLEKLSPKDYKKLLVILKKLLLAVQELADNKIAQTDLIQYDKHTNKPKYNILYKDETPQIIDLEGPRIICGKDFVEGEDMYKELGEVILQYFKANDLKINITNEDIKDENKARDLINELENRIKGK